MVSVFVFVLFNFLNISLFMRETDKYDFNPWGMSENIGFGVSRLRTNIF